MRHFSKVLPIATDSPNTYVDSGRGGINKWGGQGSHEASHNSLVLQQPMDIQHLLGSRIEGAEETASPKQEEVHQEGSNSEDEHYSN